MLLPGNLLGPRVLHPSGKELRHRCLPKQLSPFLERLELPFPSEEILSKILSPRARSKSHCRLSRGIRKETRYIFPGIPLQQKFASSFACAEASQHLQRNPGPRRGKEDAFEKQNAGRWHIITLQEASEYVDHDILTYRFHVTHYAGCAILLNKDNFLSQHRCQIYLPS